MRSLTSVELSQERGAFVVFVVLMIWVKDGSDCNVNREISCNNKILPLIDTIIDQVKGK